MPSARSKEPSHTLALSALSANPNKRLKNCNHCWGVLGDLRTVAAFRLKLKPLSVTSPIKAKCNPTSSTEEVQDR